MPRRAIPAWVLPHKDITEVERVGGHPALDFSNTVSWRGQAREVDYLKAYRSLTSWGRAVGLLASREAGHLERVARRAPREAAEALTRARALREAIFQVCRSITRGATPPTRAVTIIHTARVEALQHGRLKPGPRGHWAAAWAPGDSDLNRAWWPVAIGFADWLEHPGPHPLGMCPDCNWLFLDLSRNTSRRWCSSGDCGNRARGLRFRTRHQKKP